LGWGVWGNLGGLIQLAQIDRDYAGAVRADFRSIYHTSWDELGGSLSYREAIHLVRELQSNPMSRLGAEVNGWSFPVSFEWMVLAELIDVTVQANSKRKPKPFPRPWGNNQRRIGRTQLSRERVIELLTSENVRDVE